jgi:hypothetical protein
MLTIETTDHVIKIFENCVSMVIDPNTVPLAGLDGKTDLLTGLLAGKQGWKCPVALLATCCGSKSLKVILK